jgi:hypothetical protein
MEEIKDYFEGLISIHALRTRRYRLEKSIKRLQREKSSEE